jgi:hypothetical protein
MNPTPEQMAAALRAAGWVECQCLGCKRLPASVRVWKTDVSGGNLSCWEEYGVEAAYRHLMAEQEQKSDGNQG